MQEHGLVVTHVQIVSDVQVNRQINRGLILIKFEERFQDRGPHIF
jgi:hypothetical protein